MSKAFFYESPILPSGFALPRSYVELARAAISPDLEPWTFLFSSMARSLQYYGAMLLTYPDKPLVPFAMASDQSGYFNDGYVVLACFDGDDRSGDPKVYIHDYADPKRDSWQERYVLRNFDEWSRVAKEESDRYKAELADE
jgi:hypothetical protein